MKTLLSFLLIIVAVAQNVNAQNSVSVNQNGKGNKVIINQSTSEANQKEVNCIDKKKNKLPRNSIILKNQADTLYEVNNDNQNILSRLLDGQQLKAYQSGQENILDIFIPDTEVVNQLHSMQQGAENRIFVGLNNTEYSLSFLQKGRKNYIAVNPCPGNDKK